MKYSLTQIVTENKSRWARLRTPYDPLTGEGSPLKRSPLLLSDSVEILVPETMLDTPLGTAVRAAGTFERAVDALLNMDGEVDQATVHRSFLSFRCKHDFEFWAATCVQITDRLSGKLIAFTLNREQRSILVELEAMRLQRKPIRMVLLKARQIGMSTFIQLYIAWLQLFHVPGKNAFIIADEDMKAHNILEIYQRMARHHPENIIPGLDRLAFKPYAQSTKARQIVGREQYIGVASSKSPDTVRSFTVSLFQFSEVAYWDDTPARNPASIIQAVAGTFPENQPNTLYVEESTANGPGDYFHKSCLAAQRGDSKNKFAFVPFYENASEYYQEVEAASFIESMSDYEWFQWEQGATLEHIAWWRFKARDPVFAGDLWRVKAEFPCTWTEPFEGTGQRVFRIDYVLGARKTCLPPAARGVLIADGQKGKGALQGIRFEEHAGGELKIWKYPGTPVLNRVGKRYTNRYCAFADVGGRTADADYSAIAILDRAMLYFGGQPEIVAELRTHMDQDLFAWMCARLCAWYENALLAVEINKIIEPDTLEPDSGYTILDEIKHVYPNLYYRVQPETVREHWNGLIGFHTNSHTKKMIIDHLNGALRDREYIERSEDACNEFDHYEFKDSGRAKMGAREGENDDLVIVRAGVLWLSSQMPAPNEVDMKSSKPHMSPKAHPAVF